MRKLEEFKRQKWEIEKRFKGRAENEEEELIFFEVKKKIQSIQGSIVRVKS